MSKVKKEYEVHWRDYHSPLVRNEIWSGLSYLWPKYFKLPYIKVGILSEKDKINYFVETKGARNFQKKMMERIKRSPEWLINFVNKANYWGKELNLYTKRIHQADLSCWTGKDLWNYYKKFVELQKREYAIGVPLILLDEAVGKDGLDNLIMEILKRYLPEKEAAVAYEIFTMSIKNSFARLQEFELLKIYSDFLTFKATKFLNRFSSQGMVEKLRQSYPILGKRLKRHTEKWAWIYFVYDGPAWAEANFIEVIKNWWEKKLLPKKILKDWQASNQEIKKTQTELIKKIKPTLKERKILYLGSLIVWAKPRRKDYQSKSYWHMETFYQELSRRFALSRRQSKSLTQKMIQELLVGKKINLEQAENLYKKHLLVSTDKHPIILTGRKAKSFIKRISQSRPSVLQGHVFFGTTVCPGYARGLAVIVNSPKDMLKMQKGYILVSVATTPSIVSAMKKAAAIITDEGGLTCHAAIVSRELNIPCVVGLKVATECIRDGNMVEVDANKGMVKKL